MSLLVSLATRLTVLGASILEPCSNIAAMQSFSLLLPSHWFSDKTLGVYTAVFDLGKNDPGQRSLGYAHTETPDA